MTFTLEKADSQVFARWWVVYRNTNEEFSQQFAEQYQDVVDVPFCHWIMRDGQRVGGIIMVEHNVGDFFLITPFQDAYQALKGILPADKGFFARGILSDHVPAFQMLGFQIEESRRWMLRPTQAYPDVTFDFRRTQPQPSDKDSIAQLMLSAFQGGVGEYGRRPLEAHQQSTQSYFDDVASDELCQRASSVLWDGEQMIGACLVQQYKSLVTIRFVVTHPDYQGRGIGRKLMHHAIDTLHGQHDYIALAVTIGNPAQGLYHDMGFVSGAVTYTLSRKPKWLADS